MQTETIEKTEPLFKDFPPALPPAAESAIPPAAKNKRRQRAGILLRAICLLTSLSVLTLSAVQKLGEIIEVGMIRYIGNELMGISAEALGENVGDIAFGENTMQTVDTNMQVTLPIDLPAINYIPLDEIKNQILEDAKLHDEKLAQLYSFDASSIPDKTYPIIPTDYGTSSMLKLKNDTSFTVNMEEIYKKALSLAPVKTTGEPLVLIVHTHGTEGFAEEGKSYYNDSINYPRSEDVSKNIVAVGKVLCDVLNENGIPTIHCETMHDKESYISAYERTAESIKHYLEKYPSIQYVFDVHRDSLIRTDLTKLKPVTLYENEPCAQVMMIIGSNEKGATEYDWESNLVLAEAIQQNLFEDASGVARQLYLRGATYNQQYTKHGLLIEIGSCGNTLKEAKNAARAFGEAVVKVLKSE